MANLYEQVTDVALAETRSAMETEYGKLIQAGAFDPENNPLGISDALNVLHALLRVAIDGRARLDGRLADCVKEKGAYSGYYTDLENMDLLNGLLQSEKQRRREKKKEWDDFKKTFDIIEHRDMMIEVQKTISEEGTEDVSLGGMFL